MPQEMRKNSDFVDRSLASAANPPGQGSTNATALRYHTRLPRQAISRHIAPEIGVGDQLRQGQPPEHRQMVSNPLIGATKRSVRQSILFLICPSL